MQSLTIKPLRWIFRLDLEHAALGKVARDRIGSPDNAFPMTFALLALGDAGARRRGEPLPSITMVETRGWALAISTGPAITRVQLEVDTTWIAEQPLQDHNAIWRRITTRQVVVEADADGRIHPQWKRLQQLDWDDCESQEQAA